MPCSLSPSDDVARKQYSPTQAHTHLWSIGPCWLSLHTSCKCDWAYYTSALPGTFSAYRYGPNASYPSVHRLWNCRL